MSAIGWLVLLGYVLGWLVCAYEVAMAFAPPASHPDTEEQWTAITLGFGIGGLWPLALLGWLIKQKVFHEQAR